MSKIIFKPYCEQCGALIDQVIQYKRTETVLEVDKHIHLTKTYYGFNPCQCKVCGAVFDSVEIPLIEEVEHL